MVSNKSGEWNEYTNKTQTKICFLYHEERYRSFGVEFDWEGYYEDEMIWWDIKFKGRKNESFSSAFTIFYLFEIKMFLFNTLVIIFKIYWNMIYELNVLISAFSSLPLAVFYDETCLLDALI